MDDGLLTKAEEYFGKPLTKAGFGIICLGAVVLAGTPLWSQFGAPLVALLLKEGFSARLASNLAGTLLILGMAVMLAGDYIRQRKERRAFKRIQAMLDTVDERRAAAEGYNDMAERFLGKTRETLRRAEEQASAVQMMLEECAELLRQQGPAGVRMADEIISMLATTMEASGQFAELIAAADALPSLRGPSTH